MITGQLNYTLLALQLLFAYTSQQECCRFKSISRPGDIVFASILPLHDPKKGKCGKISPENFQIAVALNWIVDKLNGHGTAVDMFVPGVELGKNVGDNTRSIARSINIAI